MAATRFVHLGVDPLRAIRVGDERRLLLFICSLDRAWQKGLEIALDLSDRFGFRLVIAGAAADPNEETEVREACRGRNVELRGEIFGAEKAEVYARAKALLFPTQFNEAFGTSVAEALMSATPVITSDRGAMPEVVSPDVGFVCSTFDDYVRAVRTSLHRSRGLLPEKAMRRIPLPRRGQRYVVEYGRAIEMFDERLRAQAEEAGPTNFERAEISQ